jgi:Spy/CpxP family protein refolding chaperone
MKRSSIILFLVLLTIVNVAALATIGYHRFHPRKPFHRDIRPDMHKDFVKQELELNEKQVEQFEAHVEKLKTEMEPILDSLRTKRKDLMDEILADEPSMDKLNRLSEEIGALHVQLGKKTTAHMLKAKSFLTPEQQRKFFSLFEEGRDRARSLRDGRRGTRRGPGHPDFEEGE